MVKLPLMWIENREDEGPMLKKEKKAKKGALS